MNVDRVRGKILLDTNVLIYATLSGDSRHTSACEILEMRNRKGVEVFVSIQNLAEMYPNLTGPKNEPPDSPAVARAKIRSIASLPGITVLPMTMETISRALELCERYGRTRQDYFDMQLGALMLEEGIETVITENTADFKMVEGIKALNPFS
jgi:predicted nucleic acid-binding protein